jgi:hypothetical protein
MYVFIHTHTWYNWMNVYISGGSSEKTTLGIFAWEAACTWDGGGFERRAHDDFPSGVAFCMIFFHVVDQEMSKKEKDRTWWIMIESFSSWHLLYQSNNQSIFTLNREMNVTRCTTSQMYDPPNSLAWLHRSHKSQLEPSPWQFYNDRDKVDPAQGGHPAAVTGRMTTHQRMVGTARLDVKHAHTDTCQAEAQRRVSAPPPLLIYHLLLLTNICLILVFRIFEGWHTHILASGTMSKPQFPRETITPITSKALTKIGDMTHRRHDS